MINVISVWEKQLECRKDTFPNHNYSSQNIYVKVVRKFRQTGNVMKKHVRIKTINNEISKGNIIAKDNENPYVNLR